MADKSAQLQACAAAAGNLHTLRHTAATKDEALDLAIGAAELLMKALKLASSAEEKHQLKSQCGDVMNIADRIKNSAEWMPQQPMTHENVRIHEQATDFTTTADASTALDDLILWANSVPSIVAPVEHASLTAAKSSVSFSSARTQSEVESNVSQRDTQDTLAPLIEFTDDEASSSVKHISRSATDRGFKAFSVPMSSAQLLQPNVPRAETESPWPSTASCSHIHRLAEPVSTRKRSKREDIILLRASMVNGFKCPPWQEIPPAAEFASQGGVEQFTDTHDLSLSPYQQQFFQGWVRARHAVPPPSMISNDMAGIGPLMTNTLSIDLVQDAATDCSVVTSLCAGIARAERGHDQMLLNKLYPYDKKLGRPVLSSNGKYVVRLNFNGCWRKVVIDDRLPVSNTHRLLHVIDRRNPALLWPALLEKAYLKVRGGYDFPGSNSCSDLWTMTGWIPEQIFLQEADTVPDQLWSRIYNGFLYGDVLVTVGTGKMSTRQERELGLEGQHSYVVLDMKQTDQDRLLLVKNPWVEGKGWRGPRPLAAPTVDSRDDPKNSVETYHMDSIPTRDRPHPTTFWIGLEQIIQHFESLYLNWNPGLFGYRQDIHFEWKIESQSPNRSIIEHPQFALTSRDAHPIWLLLSRHFRDAPTDIKEESDAFNDGSICPDLLVNSSGESPKGYMSVYVCGGLGQRLYMKDTYLESSDYVTTPQCLLRWDTDADSTYTVVIDQDELPPSLYTFSLSAFSNSPITLEPAAERYPQHRIEEGAWTKLSAGGNTDSTTYFQNPQYSLEVRQGGPLALLLTSDDHEHHLHVKLALGHGKRLFSLTSRDVLVDSGDHRSGCVFAEIQDLQPGLYTIICSLFEAGQTGNYSLRVDSTSDIALQPIPREGAGLFSTKLAPACFGANVHKVAAPLCPQRLASYTIIARFLNATSPRSMDLGKLARSPLRLSVEIGRGPERKFVVASEGGQYSHGLTVRSESVDIDPPLFRWARGELCLVLDRLSRPGGPIEEWYEVEIFTDVPNAFEIGVWRNWD